MVEWSSGSKSVQSSATTTSGRLPMTNGTQEAKSFQTSTPVLEKNRSTCLTACFPSSSFATARARPSAPTASCAPCRAPTVAWPSAMISTPRIVYNSAHPMTVGMRGSVRLQSPLGWKTIDWSKRDPDEMVIWEEMFPDDRVDHFLSEDERVFFASEHYCRKPACSCSQVRLVFMEIKANGKYRQVGSVLVGLPGGEVRELDASRRDAGLLHFLWAAFQRRHLVAVG